MTDGYIDPEDFVRHDWCGFTMFCMRCGLAAQDLQAGRDRDCGGNIIGISHHIGRRRLREMMKGFTLEQP